MLARISSASLVQANGQGWSFQWSMKAPMVATSCLTEVNEPRRMAWRVMIEKKHSTRLSHEHPVRVKCSEDPLNRRLEVCEEQARQLQPRLVDDVSALGSRQ